METPESVTSSLHSRQDFLSFQCCGVVWCGVVWCGVVVVVCGPPGSSRSVSVSALTLTASKAGSHLVVLELLLELLLVLQMD